MGSTDKPWLNHAKSSGLYGDDGSFNSMRDFWHCSGSSRVYFSGSDQLDGGSCGFTTTAVRFNPKIPNVGMEQ